MFKLASTSKNSKAELLTRKLQMTPLVGAASRGIRAPHINLTGDVFTQKRKEMYDVHASISGHLGIMFLNKEHRFNTLSPSFCTEVSRGVGSLYEDRLTKAIYISTHEGKQWSNGTDFRTILSMKKEQNYKSLGAYLEQLYQLQTQIAKTNKPILAVAPGHAFNSGATLLASTGFPMMTVDSQMAFNECTFGFVPHSGATYYLSRLPQEFGTFLALTGMPIHGTDAAQLKLVDSILQTTKWVEEEVADVVYSQGYDPREMHAIQVMHEVRAKEVVPNDNARMTNLEIRNKQNIKLNFEAGDKGYLNAMRDRERQIRGFEESGERVPSSVADAEAFYAQHLRNESMKHQDKGIGYLDYGQQPGEYMYQRVYQPQMDYIKSHISHGYEADKTVAVQHSEMIGRCFYSNSIEEIMQNLREEGSPFAMKCHEAMVRNSDLSMRLALKMLRQASGLDYASCLRMEVKVASKMVETKEFDIGVQEVLMSAKKDKGQKHPNAGNYPTRDPNESLDSFFEGSPWAKDISVGAMEHALLPTRHYYHRFHDQVRLWINEESTIQDEVRSQFDTEVKEALQEQGIDIRDRGLTMQSAREHLAAKLAQERREQVFSERMEQMMSDTKLRAKYFDKVHAEVGKLKSMPKQELQETVDKCIMETFEQAYLGRLQHIYKKSKEAQTLERRRMFLRLKRFLFKSRCISQGTESFDKQVERLQNYSYKLPHASTSWVKSWRETPHPMLHKSPLSYISKAIGRASISPVELTKEYLTNPAAREQLSMLTIDKEELLKIQKDIYEDPQKYETILTKEDRIDWGVPRHLNTPLRKDPHHRLSDYEFWHSQMNDGTDESGHWPYYREFEAYQGWFEGVEHHALDTLKFAIAQLLAEFDKENAVFEEGKKSKKEQLRGLLNLIEGEQETNSKEKNSRKKANAKRERKMTSSKRDLDYINHLLDDVVCADSHLKPFLDPALAEKNPTIAKIQTQARDQLLQLLEMVLLDKYDNQKLGKEEQLTIKQRLASLMSPSGLDREKTIHQQMKLIDSYLMDESSKSTLQSAVETVKPLYFQFVDSLLTEAGESLAEQLSLKQTHGNVILYYYLNKFNPGMFDSELYQKLMNYSKKGTNTELYYLARPMESPTFKRRLLMNSFSNVEDTLYLNKSDIEAQKEKVHKQMERALKLVEEQEARIEAMETSFDAEADEINKALDTSDENVKFRAEFYTQPETAELAQWDGILKQVQKWLLDHGYELQNNFSIYDWLEIYAVSIQDYGLDMNGAIRVEKAAEKVAYKDSDGKTADEWKELGAAARYIADYKSANAAHRDLLQAVGTPDFLSTQADLYDSASHSSIWQRAIEKKNEFIQEQKRTNPSRQELIRTQLKEFNHLQEIGAERDQLVRRIEQLTEAQPVRVQNLVSELLNSSNTYVDFEKLADKLGDGQTLTPDSLPGMVNVTRLISDVRADKGPNQIKSKLYETAVDVQSIEDAKVEIESDSSLTQVEKAQMLKVISHVNGQLQYVSNSRRLGITIGQFLSENHSTAPSSYSDFTSQLLQRKLRAALGESAKDGSVVDWEVDGVRTSPIDHQASQDNYTLLSSIKKDQEKAAKEDQSVIVTDRETGYQEERSLRDHTQMQLIRHAKDLTRLPDDMEQYKNYYENKLLQALMKEGGDEVAQEAQSKIIDEYMSLRYKTCMLNGDFVEQVKTSDNGHLFMKVLRERIVDELGLTSEPKVEDMLFNTMHEKSAEQIKYDMDSAYNMQEVNNTEAMGYDNLDKRDGTFNNSHTQVFDKLLSDYYLSQRGDYAESNKVMEQLTTIFEDKMHKRKHVGSHGPEQNLNTYKHQQEIEKSNVPFMHPRAGKTIFELDMLTQQATQKGKSGLSDSLRQLSIADTEHEDYYTTQVPEYFEYMDVRKPPQTYVADKLQTVVTEAFEVRRKVEKNMSRRELLAFDRVLAQYLEPKSLVKRLDEAIEQEYSHIFQGKQLVDQATQRESSLTEQLMKEVNTQRDFNKKVKDEDALFKNLAFSAMTEQKYKKQMENPDHEKFIDKEYMTSHQTFERLYLNQLDTDAFKEPREISQADYEPKKFMYATGTEAPTFQNQEQREEQFFKDHALFLENKKEQQDRIQLFYILEQFFEQSRSYPDKMSEAQDHMKEYFSDPDNTFFFDKNKIQ